MLGKWKVREVNVAGVTFFQAYRLTDAVSKKHRTETFGGYWTTREEAQELADNLNEEENNGSDQ